MAHRPGLKPRRPGWRLAVLVAVVLALHLLVLNWVGRQLGPASVLKDMGEPLFTRLLAPQTPPKPPPAGSASANGAGPGITRPTITSLPVYGPIAQAQPEPAAEPKPAAKPKPKPRPRHKPPPKPAPKPAPKQAPESRPAPQAEAQADARPEPAPRVNPEPPVAPQFAGAPSPETPPLPAAQAQAPTVLPPASPAPSPAASAPLPGPAAAAAAPPPSAADAANPSDAAALDTWPRDSRLRYSLSGMFRSGQLYGGAQVQWQRAGNRYQVRVTLDITLAGTRVLTSQGIVTPQGLVPQAYEETRNGAHRRVVRMEGDELVLNDGRRIPQPAGVQDTASQFVELGHRFASGRERLQVGRSIQVPLARPGGVDLWTFDVVAEELLELPHHGQVAAFRLRPRQLDHPRGNITPEIWYAPTLQYLPVRIRVSMGDEAWVDLQVDSIEQR